MPLSLAELDQPVDNPELAEKLSRWWELRRERQAAIDASIARHSDVELLYDQPYEDRSKGARQRSLHRGKPLAAPGAEH